VFGAQDGLLVPLGVVSSVAGAFNNNHIVIIAGVSEALAGAFSMATGAFLSSQAEKQVHDAAIKKEQVELKNCPENEKKEMTSLFEKEGVEKPDSETLVKILSKYKNSYFTTMVQKEFGIDPDPISTPIGEGLIVGGSYMLAALVPLFPYFFFTGTLAIIISILCTFLALFCIGVLKAKFALLPYLKSGLQVLLIGAGAGIGGYFLGTILPHLFGIK
jgi:VIT1/CCC1 family predicted Fe2+/Mn2+ transporter